MINCTSPKCPVIGGMRQRVECARCKAHRDLTIAPICMVCGAARCSPVSPTAGDMLDGTDRAVIEAAEALDLALHDGLTVTEHYHLAVRLRLACRDRALALAGRTA